MLRIVLALLLIAWLPAGVSAQGKSRTGGAEAVLQQWDADHDGTISKEEFMSYGGKQFDKMKDKNGMMTTADATKYFARGNQRPDSK